MAEPNLHAPKPPRPPSTVTIYAPDGTPHVCAPIDAREILASGNGYTREQPAVVVAEVAPIEPDVAEPEPRPEPKKVAKKK